MTYTLQFSEWFWSEASALQAAKRFEKHGYTTQVAFAMRADGSSDWIVRCYA